MKIAFIRARYNPFGGAERFLNSAAAALVTQGESPTIITRSWPDSGDAGIEHRIVNPRYLTKAGRDRSFARATAAMLARETFDLVQSYERMAGCDVFHAVDGVHAEWLAQRRRVQGGLARLGVSLNPHHRYVLNAERAMYASPQLKAVICISEMVKQNVMHHYGLAADRLHVIYGDIDSNQFHPMLRDLHRTTLRKSLNIPADAPVAIFVGSGFERKGATGFLETVARVRGLHGLIVGHDKRLPRYRDLAVRLGVADRVRFTGGIKDVRPYYGASDVFLMPTLYEPFGLVFGEAMACGLPAITSPQAGAADWIRSGENGFVVDPLDIAALAGAVERALADPAMGRRARATVVPYTREATAARYTGLYRQLLA
ncbi:MAG: glycosyltransferase family 4 protein [Betaproteobacteria bacterium]